jgi:hypothetical protein
MIRRHPLDVGPPEPDWGQRNDDPRDPDPVVAVRSADPDPDPEPDWEQLRGDGSSRVETPTPVPRTRPDPQKQPQKLQAVFQDPSPHEMVGGVIYRPRDRLAPSRRSDLEATELAMFYKEPACVVLQRRKGNAHWLWR